MEMHTSLCELMTRSNSMLATTSPEDRFVTVLAVVIDPTTRTLAYVRCGHLPGFVMNAAGEVTLTLELGDLPLGVLPDVEYHQSEPYQLQAGDMLVLLTDGILEAASPDWHPLRLGGHDPDDT